MILCGIDIGTSGVRVALFTPTGEMVGDASVATGFDVPQPGWAEADASRFWSATQACVARLPAELVAGVKAIAVTGQAPTAVLVDADGAPTTPAILWLDTRAEKQAKRLGVQAYYLGPKLAWLARHRATALAEAKWILQSHAFVAMKLTGEVAIDYSTAAMCLPHFDLARREWLQNAYASQLPPVRGAGEVLGRTLAGTGFPVGIPVAVGGGDFACATLGAGVVEEGEACLMLGTAGNLLIPRRTPGTDPRLINSHHVGVGGYLSLGGTLSGGAMEWLRGVLGNPSHADLEREAAAVPAGAEGVLFLPYLQGDRTPNWDTSARGVFAGLGLNHGRGHLWRAMLEGIALSFADCQAVVAEDGVQLTEVFATDGGGKSALFRQVLSDALGVPLHYAPTSSGTVAGAALLAAQCLDLTISPKSWRPAPVSHAPSAEATALYAKLLKSRRSVYAALKSVSEPLS